MCKKSLLIISIILIAISISVAKTELKQGASRLPTKEQLKAVQEKRAFKAKLEAAIERPMKAAEAKMKSDRLEKSRRSVMPKSTITEQDKLKRAFRKSARWQRFAYRGSVSDKWIQVTRNGPTVLINDLSSTTIDAGEAFEISLTFSSGEDSAQVDVFFDVNGDQVVDAEDISLFAYLPPGKGDDGGPEAPFWVYDNSREDENPANGEFLVTVDDFPYMGMSMIFQVTDGGGTDQAFLTVNNLTGDYTASGTVTPITAPALVFFSHEMEDEEPFMTFTDDAGVFSFGFQDLEGDFMYDFLDEGNDFMLGAMDVALGVENGEYLFHGMFFGEPGDLEGVTIDITRDASLSGSVIDAETSSGIEDAWIGAYSGYWNQFIMGYTTSDADGDFTLPLQSGRLVHDIETFHHDYMHTFCLDFPTYVSAGAALEATCELDPWPAFIEGYVTDEETGDPLWDINVEIWMWDGVAYPESPLRGNGPNGDFNDGDMGFWNDTWTDEDGYYRLGTIYGIGELCARDWDMREYQGYCEFGFEVDQDLVTHNFQLQPFDGAITGVVTDASTGDPLPGAEIWAQSEEWFFQWDMTDEEGIYRLPVMNGTYMVCTAKWKEGYDEECVEDVEVQDNVVTQDIALNPPDGIIQGYVYDEDSQPIPGVGVDAWCEFHYYYTETDKNGFFKMGVDNGNYDVCFYDWPNLYEDTCMVDIVVSDDTQELPVYLIPIDWDGAISGDVKDDYGNSVVALVGAIDTVNWEWEDEFEFNVTITDWDGEYLLPLNNGDYVAVAFPLGWGYLWDIDDVVIDFDTVDVDFVTPVVKLDATISGTVTDTAGNLLEEAWVTADVWFDDYLGWWWDGGGLFFDAETDANGDYEMDVMGFDDRYYWVFADYWDPETGDLWMGGIDSVQVQSGAAVTVDIVLEPVIFPSMICGYVNIEGEPVAGAEVRVEDEMTGDYFITHTDENGYYCAEVFNGDYDVCANLWDYNLSDCESIGVLDEEGSMDFYFGEVAVDQEIPLPTRFALHQNHPNPFNPVTTIRYDLPEAGRVQLTVYDILGQEISTLINDNQTAGYHAVTWNGRDRFGRDVATGVYIYQLMAGDFVSTKKLIFLK